MNEEKLAIQALQVYREARTVLTPLLASLELLGLLRGAFVSGILTTARTSSSPAQIAAAINMDQARVIEFCYALDAHGVFEKENENYRLTDMWVTLIAPETSLFSFQTVLDAAFARTKALQLAASGNTDFWTFTSDERLDLAKGGSGIDPTSPHSAILVKALLQENVPELHAVLTAGGNFLELGCGVAGGLLSTLCAYPNTTAVGVEIAPDLVEEARHRAVALGVNDRVVFWQGDARNFNEREAFDYIFWSQFYFPPASRPPVLQVALPALKPGGVLIAPVQGDSSVISEQLHTEAGQAYTRSRVIFGSWGIPAQTSHELQQELEAAGFENIRLSALINPVVVAQRPFSNHREENHVHRSQ
jgi:protein-L-isoaspartate O-methyltransferase